jgi:serine protease AprX
VYSLVLAAFLVFIGAGFANAQDSSASKVDRSLRASLRKGANAQRVIVMTAPGHKGDIKKALQGHGDLVSDETDGDALSAIVHSEDVDELAKHPWVQSVSADAVVRAFGAGQGWRRVAPPLTAAQIKPSPASVTVPTNILRQTLGLNNVATPGGDGDGVVVALIDSGLSPNADLPLSRIAGFYDFTNLADGQPTQPAPYDEFGHGTHVAGLIGSGGALSNYEHQGVAPGVRFVAMKVLDGQGVGTTSLVIKALEFVIAHNRTLHVKVINLSLGHPIYAPAKYDPLVQAVERAVKAGIVVVVAAGNNGLDQNGDGESGYTGINSPANAPSAIAVGAVDTKNTITRDGDVVAAFSSRGPTWFDGFAKPDLVAPGVHLVSDADPSSYLYTNLPNNRQTVNGHPMLDLSGTSMSAPVAAGVAALVLDANADLTPNTVKGILEYTAIRIPDADYLTQGAGEVNAGGAVALASAIDADARTNSWWLQTGVPGYTTIGGTAHPWSEGVIWHNTVLGGQILYYKNIIWGTNIVWGTNAKIRGRNIIWGTHVTVTVRDIVWGTSDDDNIIWGTHLVWNNRVIGQRTNGKNIIWSMSDDDNIIWGTMDEDNIVWGTYDDADNIVWGTWDGDDNIIWGTSDSDDNIVWGTESDLDNIVWGTESDLDNIVWGTSAPLSGAR